MTSAGRDDPDVLGNVGFSQPAPYVVVGDELTAVLNLYDTTIAGP